MAFGPKKHTIEGFWAILSLRVSVALDRYVRTPRGIDLCRNQKSIGLTSFCKPGGTELFSTAACVLESSSARSSGCKFCNSPSLHIKLFV